MRKLFLIIPCAILCGGQGVPPLDADAVPRAISVRQAALKACDTRTDFKTNAEVLDCIVAADREFATTIRLRDTDILTAYANQVKALENDIAGGGVQPADIATRFRAAQNAFFKAVNGRYVDYQSVMAQDRVREMTDAADRAAQQQRSMDNMGMNGMNGMNGMGN